MTGKLQKETNQAKLSSLFPTRTHRKSRKPSFRLWPSRFRKVAKPPSDLLNYIQNRKAHIRKERTPSFQKKAHDVRTVTKKTRNPDKPTENQRETQGAFKLLTLRSSFKLSAYRSHSLFLHFSQHIPLLLGHSPFMCDKSTRELLWHCEHSERSEPRSFELTQPNKHPSCLGTAMWQLGATRPSSKIL